MMAGTRARDLGDRRILSSLRRRLTHSPLSLNERPFALPAVTLGVGNSLEWPIVIRSSCPGQLRRMIVTEWGVDEGQGRARDGRIGVAAAGLHAVNRHR